MDTEQTPVDETKPVDDVAADGYYGEDDVDDEELDLSFLDEEEASEKVAGEEKTSEKTAEGETTPVQPKPDSSK